MFGASTQRQTIEAPRPALDLDDGARFPVGAVLQFDLDAVDPTVTIPIALTSGGVKATVSAITPFGPGSFTSVPSANLVLVSTPHAVVYEPTGFTGSSFKITFSEPVVELNSLYFATKDARPQGAEVTLQAYLGTELVGTVHASGTIDPGGVYTEGNLSFDAGLFDSLVISVSSGQDPTELAIGSFEIGVLPTDIAFPLILTKPIGNAGSLNQSALTISGQLEDLAPLGHSVVYRLDDQTANSVPVILGSHPNSGQFSISLTGLTEGQHTLVLQATNQAGQTSEQTVTFTIDLTAPTMTIDPIGLEGLIGSSATTITGVVRDTTLVGESVRFRLDDGTWQSTALNRATDGLSGTFTIPFTDLTEGEHDLTVQGLDQAGNSIETIVTIIYDATAPGIVATLGRDGFVNTPNPVLTGSVSDTYSVSESITYSIDGATPVTTLLDRDQTLTEGLFAISNSGLVDGLHVLAITATDRVGNTSTQTFSFIVDLTAPTLTIDPIGNQGYISLAPITGTLNDNRRVYQTIRYAFDGGSFVEGPVDPGSNGTAVRFAIPTLGLSDGPHTVVIIGEDQAGNTVQSSASFIVDTHGPRVATITPAGTVIGPHNRITITLADDRIIADKITSGANYILEASGGDGVFGDANAFAVPIFDEQIQYDPTARTISIDLPAPLAEDTYRLVIRGTGTDVIRDLAGNSFNDGADFVHRFVILDLPAVTREPGKTIPAGIQPVDLTITDLDSDGRGDLVAVDLASGVLTVALNGGRTEWRSVQTVNLGVGPIHGLAAGDFNEDGKPDLLLQGPSRVFLALGNGRGGFSLAQTIEPAGPHGTCRTGTNRCSRYRCQR